MQLQQVHDQVYIRIEVVLLRSKRNILSAIGGGGGCKNLGIRMRRGLIFNRGLVN